MLALTDEYVPSQDRMLELAESTSPRHRLSAMETEDLFREYGVPICTVNGRLTVPRGEVGSPTSAYISNRPCTTRGGEKVGSFHTHPTPPPAPSYQDMRMFNREGDLLQCIGTKLGNQPIVACYFLRTRDKSELASYDIFTSRGPFKTETPFGQHVSPETRKVGTIHAVDRRSVTPRQILDDYRGIVKDVAEDTPGMSYNGMINDLKEGRIPSPLHMAFRDQYKDVAVPVYSREGQEEITFDEIENMRRYFNVTVFGA